MKTLNEALDFIYSFINYETDSSFSYNPVHYNVERTKKLLAQLDHPERDTKIIHVAGTKGKGSICTIIDSLLRNQHYRTGLFTSPHVERVNERIAVDGREISDEKIVEIANRFPPLINFFPEGNKPTTFEILTAMAMLYFMMMGVQYTILETGMGGRFDSTNFSDPVISIISPISYDHMDKLGNRIEDIAFEKAGIIKERRPVVIGYQKYNIKDVIIGRAKELRCPSFDVEDLCSYTLWEASEKGTRFDANIDGVKIKNLFLSLAGKHQVENSITALFALKILNLLPEEGVIKGALKNLRFSTRLELIERERRYLLDSAHNEDSARIIAEALREVYHYENLISLVGIVKGKDIVGILKHICSVSDRLIITEPMTHKKLDTEYVFKVALSLFINPLLIKDIKEAIEYANRSSTKRDLILITGSFYTTSPARGYITGGGCGRN